MADTASPSKHSPTAYPRPTSANTRPSLPSPPSSSASSASSASSVASSSESEQTISDQAPTSRRSRGERPGMPVRPKSSSIIVPKERDLVQRERPDYPPDDARAMSPRRNSQDLERLSAAAKENMKDQARTLQSSLQALAERIDEVKEDHDKLESENRFLQDYIGGLTKTMSQKDIASSSSTKTKLSRRK